MKRWIRILLAAIFCNLFIFAGFFLILVGLIEPFKTAWWKFLIGVVGLAFGEINLVLACRKREEEE